MNMQPLILLVDDEEEILDFLERMLQPKYAVLKTTHGREALQALGSMPCN